MKRLVLTALAFASMAAPAQAYDARQEAFNFSKLQERFAHEQANPGYQVELRRRAPEGAVYVAREKYEDPDRTRVTLCSSKFDGCSGDVRLLDWGSNTDGNGPHGRKHLLQYVNRNGAVIVATVWAPLDTKYPGQRLPAIVVTPGSVQAPQDHYLYIAQTLAQAGYVVLTYDTQGQGRSDTPGEGEHEWRGVPSQQEQNFTEGTTEALDFLLSTPASPYTPATAVGRTKQEAREQLANPAYRAANHNPLWERVDPTRVGVAGHSLGASAVSKVGQTDPRVDALVAWDNLSSPPADLPASQLKPALGMSADYLLAPSPKFEDPNRDGKNGAFATYKAKGVDVMQVNIRGGGHFEFSYIPNPAFGATLRGIDMSAWYTTAWFDKYVKGDSTAHARLLTDRFCNDAPGAAVDPQGDGNLFSFYYDSPVSLSGASITDLRAACGTGVLTPKAADGYPGEYSYLEARK